MLIVAPRRRCQRSVNDYDLVTGRRWWVPWEAVPEIGERPLSMVGNVNDGPLRGGVGDPGAPTINAKKHR
jgi:hypothetical protein